MSDFNNPMVKMRYTENNPCIYIEQLRAENAALKTALAEAEKRAENLRQQAEQQAQEARTHRRTVLDCYKAAGAVGRGDWNGSEPVYDAIKSLESRLHDSESECLRIWKRCAEIANDDFKYRDGFDKNKAILSEMERWKEGRK